MNLFAVFQVARCVWKIDEHEFDLILENDLNTGGFTQWFYFRVRNQRKNKNYRFNIVNLVFGHLLSINPHHSTATEWSHSSTPKNSNEGGGEGASPSPTTKIKSISNTARTPMQPSPFSIGFPSMKMKPPSPTAIPTPTHLTSKKDCSPLRRAKGSKLKQLDSPT